MVCPIIETMSNSVIINKEKNIGKVVYVVEGDRKEITLLTHIFEKIFDYSVVTAHRTKNPIVKYKSKLNKNSQVYVVASEQSAIKSITTGQDYLDAVFEKLTATYGLDTSSAAVYYIFDRDPQSNSAEVVKDLLGKLNNSRDNGIEANGLLLLSYPSIEAYVISCFDEDFCRLQISAKKAKTLIGNSGYQQHKIDGAKIALATQGMLLAISQTIQRDLAPEDFDAFKEVNTKLFDEEERLKQCTGFYRLLSLLSVSFLDLGLITITDEKNG